MSPVAVVVLVAGALAVHIVGTKSRLPAPLVLLAAGLAVSFVPGLPDFSLEPGVILAFVLPPLLYSAALGSSYLNIRPLLRPIGLLAVGLVAVTTVAVGFAAHAVLPQLPLASALVLGAVIAPPDAVAAIAVGRKLHLPRRAMTLLGGESLANDATALTLWKVALAAATGSAISWGQGVAMFLLASVGGVVIGLLAGTVVHLVRARVDNGVLETAVGIVTPFACYALAEQVGGSGVLAVVAAGVLVGHKAPYAGHSVRLQENAVWRSIDVLLESVVFALIGLQLPRIVAAPGIGWALAGPAAMLLLVTIVVRLVWVYPSAYLPRLLSARIRTREPVPDWRATTVIGWAGMRGVVSLAVAFATPTTMPGHDLVMFFAFMVTIGTLLVHGTTLPLVIRALGVRAEEAQDDADDEARVRKQAIGAARKELERRVADDDEVTPEHVVELLRSLADHHRGAAKDWIENQEGNRAEAFQRLRGTMLDIERKVFVAARDAGEVDDEVLRRVLRELDLHQASLDAPP